MAAKRARAKTKTPAPKRTKRAYAPVNRLRHVEALLESHGATGITLAELSTKLGTSRRTIERYIVALEDEGKPIVEERHGRTKLWRLKPAGRAGAAPIRITPIQRVALALTRLSMGFLGGTGFDEYLAQVLDQLEGQTKRADPTSSRYLDRKLYDRNEESYRYGNRVDFVSDLMTALLKEERITVRHRSHEGARDEMVFEPYSLVVYRKGLYFVGLSHARNAIRTLGLDGFVSVKWRRGDRFEYPRDWSPRAYFKQHIGIFTGGEPTAVRLRFFGEGIIKSMQRRNWHSSQRTKSAGDGARDLLLHVAVDAEIENLILRFGEFVEVIEPASLRAKIHATHIAAAARNAPRESKTKGDPQVKSPVKEAT